MLMYSKPISAHLLEKFVGVAILVGYISNSPRSLNVQSGILMGVDPNSIVLSSGEKIELDSILHIIIFVQNEDENK
jgi:hypothetical protein